MENDLYISSRERSGEWMYKACRSVQKEEQNAPQGLGDKNARQGAYSTSTIPYGHTVAKNHTEPGVEGTLWFLPGRQGILAFLLPCIPAVPPNGRQCRIRPGIGVAAAPNTFQEGLLALRVDACLLCGRNPPGYISIGYLFSHCSSQVF